MSFILDALRKSETERQRQSPPGIADARQRIGPARRSPWPAVGAAALLANALLLGFLLLRQPAADDAGPVTRSASLPPAETTEPPPTPVAMRRERMPRVRPLSDEIAAAPVDRPAAAPPARDAAPAAANPGAASAAPPAPTPPPAKPRPANATAPPPLDQLIAAGAVELPELRLDLHVFSDNPAERLVFVNMRKYREGDQTAEGPAVEEITPGGVIMDYRGTRFVLDRR